MYVRDIKYLLNGLFTKQKCILIFIKLSYLQNLPDNFKSIFVSSLCGCLASSLQQFHVWSMRSTEHLKTLLLFLGDSYSMELFQGFVKEIHVRYICYLLDRAYVEKYVQCPYSCVTRKTCLIISSLHFSQPLWVPCKHLTTVQSI